MSWYCAMHLRCSSCKWSFYAKTKMLDSKRLDYETGCPICGRSVTEKNKIDKKYGQSVQR